MSAKKQALGRGLGAILQNPTTDITTKGEDSEKFVAGAVANIPISQIETNPYQPRNKFEEEKLNELAQSIKEVGVIQAITVRKLGYNKYQLISGERRLRASQIAGLTDIPAFIRIANDQQMIELALIENIQREDLDAIEVALSFRQLIDECKITQEKVSKTVGKSRSVITNYLRLLKLPPEIQAGIKHNLISMSHARSIISIEDEETQLGIYRMIIEKDLSVREVEKLVKLTSSGRSASKKKEEVVLPEEYSERGKFLEAKYGAEVNLKINNKGRGSIVINFNNDNDFERIFKLLND